MLQEKTYFDVVSVNELPEKENRYWTLKGVQQFVSTGFFDFNGSNQFDDNQHTKTTHWLKEKQGYLLSKEELIDLLNDLMTYSLGYEDKEYLQGFLNDKGLK